MVSSRVSGLNLALVLLTLIPCGACRRGNGNNNNNNNNNANVLKVAIKAWVSHCAQAAAFEQVGEISVEAGPGAKMTGDFLFKQGYADLDLAPTDFQWINVLESYTQNNVVQASHPLVGTLPAIDPAPWDGPEPFYYNAAEWAACTFGGAQIRQEGVRSKFIDSRNLPNSPGELIFRTYLVMYDGVLDFCVLGGFRWKYTNPNGNSTTSILGPLGSETNWIIDALANGTNAPNGDPAFPGYPGYTPHDVVMCMPGICRVIGPASPPATFDIVNNIAFAFAGAAVAGGADLNLDGTSDFLSGAPSDNGSSGNDVHIGRLTAFSGADGLPLLELFGNAPGDSFGVSVAFVGDVDGDGVQDILVGAPQVNLDDLPVGPGYASLHSGRTGALICSVQGAAVGDMFGVSACALGDVNGDGTVDFAVGAPLAQLAGVSVGMVRVYSGATCQVIFTAYGQADGDNFGAAIVGVSDVSGDGVNDLIVGAPQVGASPPAKGYACILSGTSGSIFWTVPGTNVGEGFGAALPRPAQAGGVVPQTPLYFGAPLHAVGLQTNVGAVYGLDLGGLTLPTRYGYHHGDCFGASLSFVPDFNGDGAMDLVVGAPQVDLEGWIFGSGYVQVFGQPQSGALSTRFGDKAGDAFGFAVACAGDVTGDGYADILVGAPWDDVGHYNAGRTRVFPAEPLPPPALYCTPKVNSLGCTPSIAAFGIPSATAGSGFVLSTVNVINNKPGLYLYSNTGQAAVPFFGGLRCVGTPVRRSVPMSSGGNPPPNDCSGVFNLDWNAFAVGGLGGAPQAYLSVPGQVVQVQAWGRDPGFPSAQAAQLSAAVEYTVGY